MSDVNRALRGGVRAVIGLAIIGAGATAAVLLSSTVLPGIDRAPVAIPVDSLQGAERTLACTGSFSELGADPSRPAAAIPVGEAELTRAGAEASLSELSRAEAGGTPPAVLRVPAGDQLSAAQSQVVRTEAVSGIAASSCVEPVNEQWLLGGSTQVGVSTTLSLGNPSQVPATVKLALFDEAGAIDSAQITGVLVPAGGERVVSINGYAPDRERIAVRVTSTGAAVSASLGIGQTVDIRPFAADTVTRQLAPSTRLVVPGVTNLSDEDRGPGDAEMHQDPVLVRVLAPERDGTATVRAIGVAGGETVLGTVDLVAGAVAELKVADWPKGAEAVVIDADVPVVGGVLGSATAGRAHDYAWFAPAPSVTADAEVAAAVVPGGKLVIANAGDTDAVVQVADGDGTGAAKPQQVKVPAGSAAVVAAPRNARVTSSAPVALGVRVVAGGDIAGYPILPLAERDGTITVYPR